VTPLETSVVALARSYLYVREVTPNSSPAINPWLRFVGCPAGAPYCSAFVSWCVLKGVAGLAVEAPRFKRSASAVGLLSKNPDLVVSAAEARSLLGQGVPLVFVIDHGGGKGHAGFATGITDSKLATTEANTSPGPSAPAADRGEQGCFERTDRLFASVHGWLRIA
jgi:hypothetical protein